VDLGAQPAFGSSDCLFLLFFNRPSNMFKRTNDGTANHGVLVVSIAGRMGKHRRQETALGTAAEPPTHIFPIAKLKQYRCAEIANGATAWAG
jgi:hypothetical protein